METMETAADKIRSVVKDLLPEHPYHLSLYPERKYPVPPNYLHHQSQLQYSTFIADADRGVLLTRPHFDICEEPEPEPATSQPAARPVAKKPLNKMSFKDYQRQKKASTSPGENGVPGKTDDKKQLGAALKLERDASRQDQERSSQRDSKAHEGRVNGETDRPRSSLSKPTKDALSPETRKRPLDPEDSARPHKKPKSSDASSPELSRKALRPETPRSSVPDKHAGKDARSGAQSTPTSRNATAASSRDRDGHRAVSPRITVNGVKHQQHSLPRKPDTSGKHLVPPLLSPLRHPAIDNELETTSSRKKPADSRTSERPQSKSNKSEVAVKKQRLPPELPELLSPTLPAMVEEELEIFLGHKSSSKGESSVADSQSFERKARPKDKADEDGKPKSLIVTLKIKKKNRSNIQRLLALPSKNKKERSASVEDTPPPTKKRLRPAEAQSDAPTSIATKRPKTSEAYANKAPYTPPNPPALASQGVSGRSQTQTPGGRVAQTPGATETAPLGRNGHELREQYNRLHDSMTRLGKKLKHERDKERHERDRERHKQPNGASANGGDKTERQVTDGYRHAMMTMEMILAYMIAFRSLNKASEISSSRPDEGCWWTLDAHFKELRGMTRNCLPLHTLATQLYGILYNETMKIYSKYGFPVDSKHGSGEPRTDENKVTKTLRSSFDNWIEADKLRSKLSDMRLKTPAMGPWTSICKAATDALAVMSRFAERERVNWRAEVIVPKE